MKHLLLSIISISLVGCASIGGLGGNTIVTTKYNSDVNDLGAEKVNYEQTVKGRAGDVVQAVSQATLVTNSEGRNLSVGATQNADSTVRAATMVELQAQFNAAIAEMSGALKALAETVSGAVLGVKQAEAAASVERTRARADAASTILTPRPAQPVTPLGDLPVVPVSP